jgi:hypothetical protein
MSNMKRVPADEFRKAVEQMKAKKKVKITGGASSKPQVSGSMSKSQPKTTAGRSPKRPGSKPVPMPTRAPNLTGSPMPRRTPVPLGTPPAKPTGRRPAMPKTTKKAPGTAPKKQQKMTPQDAAMKKILEKKYGKIYG